jgi:hypothetical protein
MAAIRLPDRSIVNWDTGAHTSLDLDKRLRCDFSEDGNGQSRCWIWERHRDDPRKLFCRYYGVLPKHSAPAVVDDFGDLVLLS